MRGPMRRAVMSVGPPAENGMIMRIGLDGKACAATSSGVSRHASTTARIELFMCSPPGRNEESLPAPGTGFDFSLPTSDLSSAAAQAADLEAHAVELAPVPGDQHGFAHSRSRQRQVRGVGTHATAIVEA